MAIANSSAGVIEPVENLKRRKLAVYWRPHTNPDGNTEWIETRPLPVDPVSKEIYLSKGFRLTKPSDAPVPEAVSGTDKLYEEIANLRKELEEAKKPKTKKKVVSE